MNRPISHQKSLKCVAILSVISIVWVPSPSKATLPLPTPATISEMSAGLNIVINRPGFSPLTISQVRFEGSTSDPSRRKIILTGVSARLENDLATLKADRIVISGNLDITYLDTSLVSLLNGFGLTAYKPGGEGAMLDSAVVQPLAIATDIVIENLEYNEVWRAYETTLNFGTLSLRDVRQTNRSLWMAGVTATAVKAKFGTAPFLNQAMQTLNDVELAFLDIQGLPATPVLDWQRSAFWSNFSKLKASSVELRGLKGISRPLKMGRSSPQRESQLGLSHIKVTGLDKGAFTSLMARAFTSSRSLPVAEPIFSFDTLTMGEWNPRPFQGLTTVVDKVGQLSANGLRRTVASLWPQGPLDLGIGSFDLRNFKARVFAFDFLAIKTQLRTHRSGSGIIDRLIVPQTQIAVTPAPVLQPNGGSSGGGNLFTEILTALKLERLIVSFGARFAFDSATDTLDVEQVLVEADELGQFKFQAKLQGVEQARQKLHANQIPAILGTGVLPNTIERQGAQSRIIETLGKVRLVNARLDLTDSGVIDRLADISAQRDGRRGQVVLSDPVLVREAFAKRIQETALERVNQRREQPWFDVSFQNSLANWALGGGKLTVSIAPDDPIATSEMMANSQALHDLLKFEHKAVRPFTKLEAPAVVQKDKLQDRNAEPSYPPPAIPLAPTRRPPPPLPTLPVPPRESDSPRPHLKKL